MHGRHDYLILHVDLFVRSMEVALDFYCKKLGFSIFDEATLNGPLIRRISEGRYDALRLVLLRSSTVGAMVELQEFQQGSELTEHAKAVPLRRGCIALLVPNLRAHIERMRDHDIHPSSEIFIVKLPKSRPCEAVFFKDPDGNDLEFLQMQSS